ncbi:MAG: ABC transporter permease [Chloroflexi bacterium]|nr:ABC transporter permease [Chloroflexota bacterium]
MSAMGQFAQGEAQQKGRTRMTASTNIIDPQAKRRSRTLGVLLVLIGVAIYVFFVRSSDRGLTSTFGLNPGRETSALHVPDMVLPVLPSLYVMAIGSVAIGFYQLVRGWGRSESWMLGLVALFMTLSFLTWAARGRSLNLIGILETTLQRATPIVLAALSGVLCERSGIVNIAIEGMMLTAAATSAVVASVSHSLWVGLLAALIMAGLLGLLLAVLSIRFKVNQVISGTAINILATGATSYVSARYLQVYQHLNSPGQFPNVPVPLLARLPVLGPIFFETNVLVYLMLVLLVSIHVMLYYTRWGLRTRAIGEHPHAAATVGVDVNRMRYINVVLGGMVAGLGGAFLVLGSVPRFDELMTAGKGFIGLAALIFGKYNPFGAFGASLIFGFTDTLQAKLQILEVPIPSQFLRMLPYVITMVVLAGVVGRADAPAAEGQPYEKQ